MKRTLTTVGKVLAEFGGSVEGLGHDLSQIARATHIWLVQDGDVVTWEHLSAADIEQQVVEAEAVRALIDLGLTASVRIKLTPPGKGYHPFQINVSEYGIGGPEVTADGDTLVQATARALAAWREVTRG